MSSSKGQEELKEVQSDLEKRENKVTFNYYSHNQL